MSLQNAQYLYDNAQEQEMSRDEAIEQEQACIADRIEKDIRRNCELAASAFLEEISTSELSDENYELLQTIIVIALNCKFEDRNLPINLFISNIIRSQAEFRAKQEYPL